MGHKFGGFQNKNLSIRPTGALEWGSTNAGMDYWNGLKVSLQIEHLCKGHGILVSCPASFPSLRKGESGD